MDMSHTTTPKQPTYSQVARKLLSFPLLILLMLGFTSATMAQERTVTGTVTDTDGQPLISANVLVKGTSRGTVTDFNGEFELTVQPEDEILIFSYVGFGTKEFEIGDQSEFNVSLSEQVALSEVVVTALGVERDEKSLGYSVQKLDNEKISSVQATNAVNNLTGKVSGVNIVGGAAGPSASANVTIRGATSLTGNNQALFVVNGMPITNNLFSPGDGINGSTTIDFGNAAQILNPADIESVSVLKGASAAALYGTRASNGVILITTKTGEGSEGWGVSMNTNTTVERLLRMPDFQNTYGFGGRGKYSYNDGTTYTGDFFDAFGENWGPRMDGTPIKQWNSGGEPVPYTPAPDNVENFFRTGVTSINNVALSNSSENGDFRLSFTNTQLQGIVPNTNLQRNNIFASMGQRLFDERLDVRANITYHRSGSDNVPNAGYDESSSVMYNWLWYPRYVPIDDLRDYWEPGQVGLQQRNFEELWTNNPWFVVNENTNSFEADRLYGNLKLEYDFNEHFSARFRFGGDVKNEQRQFRRAFSTKSQLFGGFREDEITFQETNTEFLLSYDSKTSGTGLFDVSVKLGGNIMRQSSDLLSANAPQLLAPGIFNLGNSRTNVLTEQTVAEKGINSAFGLVSVGFKNWLYLDVTGRNDWSSTLPPDNNSFFYPSFSLSGVLSEVMNLNNSPLSFLKLRASYAEVGGDTDPFLLSPFFNYRSPFGNFSALTSNRDALNPNLRPEQTESYEFGVDARFLNGRLGVDLTYYEMNSTDQIIFLPVTLTSGRDNRLINGGEIENTGFEITLNAQPITKQNGLNWNVDLNLFRNRAVVQSLPEGISNYQVVSDLFPGDEGGADLSLEARPGQAFGQLVGLGFQRDDQGRIIHENGLPLLTDDKVSAGTFQPDFRFGVYNTLSYKNFNFGFLFDGQKGGKIYSRTHALMNTGGTITNNDDPNLDLSTLEGRIEYDVSYDANGNPVYDLVDAGGVVGPGVKFDDNGNLVENDVEVGTREYFYAYYGNGFNRDNIEAATYDATFVKLREVRFGYTLPQPFVDKIGLQSATVSLIGRNLALFTDVPSIDPENFSIRNGRITQGFESTSLPSTRSFGVSINVRL